MRFGFTLLAALLAVAGAVGCKKSGDASIAQMTELKTKMCACKDKACVDHVTAEMTKWSDDHRSTAAEKASEEDQKKLMAISGELTACMTQVMRDAAATAAAAAGSAAQPGSAAAGSGTDGTAAAAGSAGAADGSGAGAGVGLASSETMAHRAGMCPSTVLGATTKAAVKDKAVVVTIESSDKDAIAAIQKRADHLLAEKHDAASGVGHDMKGTHGGSQGLCPVYVPDGSKATAKHEAKGVVVTITPKDKPDDLGKEIDGRIAKAADWVKANLKEGDQGNQGGVGGGKGDDGSNHSGKGDGKGRERKKGGGGGKGTGGGGGAGTGGTGKPG